LNQQDVDDDDDDDSLIFAVFITGVYVMIEYFFY